MRSSIAPPPALPAAGSDQTMTSSRSTSDQAVVYFRPDGSAFRIDSQGHVTTTDEGQTVVSSTARVDLDAKSQPVQALPRWRSVLHSEGTGSRPYRERKFRQVVVWTAEHDPARATAQCCFGCRYRAVFRQPQNGRQPANTPVSTTRDVQASQVDIDFAPQLRADQIG